MNNNGLYIKEFEARGENVSTSKLTFQKGCNVVLGNLTQEKRHYIQ